MRFQWSGGHKNRRPGGDTGRESMPRVNDLFITSIILRREEEEEKKNSNKSLSVSMKKEVGTWGLWGSRLDVCGLFVNFRWDRLGPG